MSVSLTKIESEEYEEALSLAHTYGLDTDLVYQRQWRKSAVNIASIQNYLVCVNICGNLMKLIFMDSFVCRVFHTANFCICKEVLPWKNCQNIFLLQQDFDAKDVECTLSNKPVISVIISIIEFLFN